MHNSKDIKHEHVQRCHENYSIIVILQKKDTNRDRDIR